MQAIPKRLTEKKVFKNMPGAVVNIVALLVLTFFTYLMLAIVAKYIPIGTDNNFLLIKQTEIQTVPTYLVFFYIHVFSAALALPAGFTQFSKSILRKHSKVHRAIGYLYIAGILFLAAPSGFFIGLFANGGMIAKTSFITLAILWFFFTYQGFRSAKNRQFIPHRSYMIRSYALTLSALSLRMWKVVIVSIFHPAPMDTYVVISLLGWIPNYIIAEFIIRIKAKNQNQKYTFI
ncbi:MULTISPECIES: DUF2306 domain-containing protein [Chitinophagaceae]